MRAKGKIRQVHDIANNKLEWSYYPVALEEAVLEDVAKYWPMIPCPIHGGRPVYFRVTGEPGCCAHPAAVDAYNEAVVSKMEPKTMLQAKERGLSYYWVPQPHPLCGHPGKMLFNGKCAFCQEHREKSPRQLAIKEGLTWYTPADNDPCPKCLTVSPRRVANGSCSKCEEIEKARRASTQQQVKVQGEQPINILCPDLIIGRADARVLGYKLYRTGESCHAGHKGWRYVSTGGCLDCKKS